MPKHPVVRKTLKDPVNICMLILVAIAVVVQHRDDDFFTGAAETDKTVMTAICVALVGGVHTRTMRTMHRKYKDTKNMLSASNARQTLFKQAIGMRRDTVENVVNRLLDSFGAVSAIVDNSIKSAKVPVEFDIAARAVIRVMEHNKCTLIVSRTPLGTSGAERYPIVFMLTFDAENIVIDNSSEASVAEMCDEVVQEVEDSDSCSSQSSEHKYSPEYLPVPVQETNVLADRHRLDADVIADRYKLSTAGSIDKKVEHLSTVDELNLTAEATKLREMCLSLDIKMSMHARDGVKRFMLQYLQL